MIATAERTLPWVGSVQADEYHAELDYLSNSMFQAFLENPRLYEARYITKTCPFERTNAMDLGTVGHAAILEPHIIEGVCLEIPDSVLSANGAKSGNNWKDFAADHPGRILLKADELSAVRGMFNAVYNHPVAKRILLADGPTEQSIYWKCHLTGLKRRCRPDKIIDDWGWGNLKTTTAGTDPESFRRTVRNFGYDVGQEFYLDAAMRLYGKRPPYVFVVVSQKPPHLVAVYQLGQPWITAARDRLEHGLIDFARRMEEGDWSDDTEQRILSLD